VIETATWFILAVLKEHNTMTLTESIGPRLTSHQKVILFFLLGIRADLGKAEVSHL